MFKSRFVATTYIKFGKPSKIDNRQGVYRGNTPHTERERERNCWCYKNKLYLLKFKKCNGSRWETGARAEDRRGDFRDHKFTQWQTL